MTSKNSRGRLQIRLLPNGRVKRAFLLWSSTVRARSPRKKASFPCPWDKIRYLEPAPNPLYLISACLCGVACRYDGGTSFVDRLAALCDSGLALAVCPEVDGGLPIPRPPCELKNGRALTRDGHDVTAPFEAGAAHALRLAQTHGIRLAILKENSPSCGGTMVYDGSFRGRLTPGQGITAALLRKHGIRVVSEGSFEEALLFVKGATSADGG